MRQELAGDVGDSAIECSREMDAKLEAIAIDGEVAACPGAGVTPDGGRLVSAGDGGGACPEGQTRERLDLSTRPPGVAAADEFRRGALSFHRAGGTGQQNEYLTLTNMA